MENKLRIGGNIRKWRNIKGLKQKDLAVAMRLSEAAMSNIENNITNITLSQLEEISMALDVNVSQLFTDPQETVGGATTYKQPREAPSMAEESPLIYAVIRSMEMKDQQLQAIVQNMLHTMSSLAGNVTKSIQ